MHHPLYGRTLRQMIRWRETRGNHSRQKHACVLHPHVLLRPLFHESNVMSLKLLRRTQRRVVLTQQHLMYLAPTFPNIWLVLHEDAYERQHILWSLFWSGASLYIYSCYTCHFLPSKVNSLIIGLFAWCWRIKMPKALGQFLSMQYEQVPVVCELVCVRVGSS